MDSGFFMKYKKRNFKKGMSLIELVVTTGIIGFLVLIVSVLLVRSISAYRISNKSINLQEDAAKVMREFEYSARAATETIISTESEFSYYRFFDLTSSYPSKIRFFAENGEFKMGRTDPQGIPPDITYPIGNEAITLLIKNVITPTPIFYYYDELGNQLSAPINIPAIRMVEILITVDDDVDNQPDSVTERTKIHMRNMKTNL